MNVIESSHQKDSVTDTHLAKKYNDALYACISACNSAAISAKANIHFENTITYYSTVNTFYLNTFFLFESSFRKGEDTSLSEQLRDTISDIENLLSKMVHDAREMNEVNGLALLRLVTDAHMIIMYGLQQRNMLVRVSEKEPRGAESIKYWGQRKSFAKGGFNPEKKVIK